MIIVKVQGGIGNQMFIYALCLKLIACGREVKIDTTCYGTSERRQLSFLSEFFQQASLQEIHAWQEYKTDLFSSIRRNIGFRKKEHIREQADFMPEIFDMDGVYLDGYWQNEKYFKDIRQSVLSFWGRYVPNDSEYLSEIENSESVCVHIRRGDYLQLQQIYGNVCTDQYYEKAMKLIMEQVSMPKFFFFSDDMDWVRENMAFPNAVCVDTKDSAPEGDLYLMSRCKHNITANSSYSWWGAWLNNYRKKMVISPRKWFNNKDYNLASPEWILI